MSSDSHDQLKCLSVDWNNKGIAFFAEQRYRAAATCFHTALHVCRSMLTANVNSINDGNEESFATLDEYMEESSANWGSRKLSISLSDQHSSYVHDEPIVIPASMSDCLDVGTILPSIIIFNQALSHHCMGMKNRKYLLKAVKLYHCGLNLVIDQEIFDVSKTFTLACLNNMGLGYKQLNDTAASQICYRQLMSTLMLSMHSSQGISPKLKVYFKSISHLLLQANSPAPAA